MPLLASVTLSTLKPYNNGNLIISRNGTELSVEQPSFFSHLGWSRNKEKKGFKNGLMLTAEQIKESFDKEAAADFLTQFADAHRSSLTVGEVKVFLYSLNKPELFSLGGQSVPEYGNWESDETMRTEFGEALLHCVHQAATSESSEELRAFEADAGRSFIFTFVDPENGTVITNRTATSSDEKISQAHDVLEAAIDGISTNLVSLMVLKNNLFALSHQGIIATLLGIASLPKQTFITTGNGDFNFDYQIDAKNNLQIDAKATISRASLVHKTLHGLIPIADENHQKKGTIEFKISVSPNEDGSLKSISCSQLRGSWDIATTEGVYRRPVRAC